MKTARWIFCAFFVASLISCGGSNNSGSGTDGAISGFSERPDGNITGIAFDGLIRNGTITAYAWNGEFGEKLGEGVTNDKGEYALVLDSVVSQTVGIKVNNGLYTEEASGESVGLAEDDFLYALAFYEQGKALDVSLTYYTTIATGLAKVFVERGSNKEEAIEHANAIVSDQIGIDIQKVRPVDITDLKNAAPELTDEISYGFLTAAISELTKEISILNKEETPHFNYNSIGFAALAYKDIAFDGELNGVGESGTLNMGVVEIDASFYRLKTALSMVKISSSDVNQVLENNKAVVEVAVAFNNKDVGMFSDEAVPLSSSEPLILEFGIKDGSLVFGTVEIPYLVSSDVDLEKISLSIDGVVVSESKFKSNTITIDTTALTDGEHELSFDIENILGGTVSTKKRIKVSNIEVAITNVKPNELFVSGIFNFEASLSGSGGIIDSVIVVDNIFTLFTFDAQKPFIEFDSKRFTDGEHNFTVTGTNAAGFSGTEGARFFVDNTSPDIGTNFDSFSFERGEITLTASATDENQSNVELYFGGELKAEGKESAQLVIDTATLKDGEHSAVVVATDLAGNRNTVQSSFVSDNTVPTVLIQNISSGAELSGDITIEVLADDVTSPNGISIYLDKTLLLTDELSRDKYEVLLNTYSFDPGAHSIEAVASDEAGNIGSTLLNVYFIQSSISSLSPGEGALLGGGERTVKTDFSGILTFLWARFYVDGQLVETKNNISKSVSFSYDFSKLSTGKHSVKVEALDIGGRTVERTTIYVIDNAAPEIQWSSTGGYVTGVLSVNAEISDEHLGEFQVFVNNTVVFTGSGGSVRTTIDTTAFGEGSRNIKIKSHDQVGNTSEVSKTYIFDHYAPVFTSINLINGMDIRGEMTVQGRVEFGASLTTVELFIDGNRYDLDTDHVFSLTLNPGSFAEGQHAVELRANDNLGRVTSSLFNINFFHKTPTLSEEVSVSYISSKGGANERETGLLHTITIGGTHPTERTRNVRFHGPAGEGVMLRNQWWSDDNSTYYADINHMECRSSGHKRTPLYLTYIDARSQEVTIQITTEYKRAYGYCKSYD